MKYPASPLSSGQEGFSLIVVMLLLVVVSLLGIGAAQISLLGERTSRNDRDAQIAWQAAEEALTDAEFDIRNSPSTKSRSAKFGMNTANEVNPNDFVAGCGAAATQIGLCALQVDNTAKPAWLTANFTDTSQPLNTVEFGAFTERNFASINPGVPPTGIQPSKLPRYVIELVKDTGLTRDLTQSQPQYVFRVTAMGFGPRDDIQAVLQIIYRN